MTKPAQQTRRALLGQIAAVGAIAATPAAARTVTPSTSEGPYYPTQSMRFADQDNNLVKITSAVRRAGGKVLHLTGRVLDRDGSAIANARVEIWQTDVNARYLHTAETSNRTRDPNFQGFGFAITDAEGRYAFRTIVPTAYPGRTPHIHVKAFAGNRELTSQFYIHDHPGNAGDTLWRRMSKAEQEAVAMRFTAKGQALKTTVDIQL